MRILAVATAIVCLAGCTSVNIYQGADAATVSTVCGAEVRNEATGVAYASYTTIFQIDGSFTGSGHGCPALYVYRIRPGSRSIKLAVNFDNPNDKFLIYGIVEVAAELSPGKNYQIQTYYSSGTFGVRFIENASRAIAGSGQTAKIERSSKANAATTALPFRSN